jgi:hypothetical protein
MPQPPRQLLVLVMIDVKISFSLSSISSRRILKNSSASCCLLIKISAMCNDCQKKMSVVVNHIWIYLWILNETNEGVLFINVLKNAISSPVAPFFASKLKYKKMLVVAEVPQRGLNATYLNKFDKCRNTSIFGFEMSSVNASISARCS